MSRLDDLLTLNSWLLADMPMYAAQAATFPRDEVHQWRLFRSLVNVRQPGDASPAFLALQDHFLQEEIAAKGITDWHDLSPQEDGIYLWQGDITTLRVDAIVNAANSGMTGCYHPCHGCIDNAIHTYAGIQLRSACQAIMQAQGLPEPPGQAKFTPAFNLPCRYIIHTVGPIVQGELRERHRELLAACYRSCLQAAEARKLESLALCCISTGEFSFPHEEAAAIALREVRAYRSNGGACQVIFNVFSSLDREIYERLLS